MRKLAAAVKQKIADEIGFYDWYSKYTALDGPNDSDECKFACLAHGDSRPSASLNIRTGLWKCFAGNCGAQGDVIDLYRIVKGSKSASEAIHDLAVELGIISQITDEMVDEMHKTLISSPVLTNRVCGCLGVSEETLRRFLIGIHKSEVCGHSEARITIPIRGQSGFWEDVRRYHPHADRKVLHWAAGHGEARIFPIDVLRSNQTLVLLEGEKDCLHAQDIGITNAITVTGGSESFPPDYQDLFDGKIVYLCYDIDQAGIKGASKAARKLATCAKAVYRIDLPAVGLPANGDFSDWCNLGNGLPEFQKQIESAQQIDIEAEKRRWSNGRAQPGERNQPVDPGEALAVDYQDLNAQASAPDDLVFLAHSIGITAGMKPFVVPVSVEVTCARNQPKLCSSCRINQIPAENSPHLFQIDLQDESALRLIRCDDTKKRVTLRALCGIPARCPSARIIDRERGAFQQLLLSPPADLQTMRQEYGGFKFAYLSCNSVPDNRDYWFRGRVQPDPKTQEIVLNLHKASPARSAIDCFEVNEKTFDAIDYFKPTASDLPRHFGRLTDGVAGHVGVYGRSEVALAVLESIYSAARFRFGGREIYPGVVETLIIGDPRTGKSKLATGLMRMINVGEYITCENVSAAGLIGGLEQIDDVRVPIWGAWPRNHNGFILLDEVDELSKHRMRLDLISLLSSVRSAGVAEITKILQARAPALVRSVWITNPADGKNISTFSGAVRAIPGVVLGRPDIARFTKAYAVAMESVTTDQIAGMTVEPLPSEVCHYYNTLAILTWSLQPDQIVFSSDAERFLKRETKRLAEKYDAGIPLIDPGSCLDKIARLSIPVAVLSGNFQEAGDRLQLTIDEQHAYYAVNSLEYYYDQDTMGYLRYSQLEKDMNRLKDVEQVEALLGSYQVNDSFNDPSGAHRTGVTPAAIAKFFLSQPNPTAQSFKDFLGNPSAAQYAWSIFLRTNCLRQEGQNVTKTADFVHLLQRYLD